jgi:hypothetical protein
MNIVITKAEAMGMPLEMIANCKQLLERRVRKTMQAVPEAGAELTILYSDKDPLGTSGVVDDESYMIYFVVEEANGDSLENATITAGLVM